MGTSHIFLPPQICFSPPSFFVILWLSNTRFCKLQMHQNHVYTFYIIFHLKNDQMLIPQTVFNRRKSGLPDFWKSLVTSYQKETQYFRHLNLYQTWSPFLFRARMTAWWRYGQHTMAGYLPLYEAIRQRFLIWLLTMKTLWLQLEVVIKWSGCGVWELVHQWLFCRDTQGPLHLYRYVSSKWVFFFLF